MGLLRRRRGRDLPAPAYSNEAVIGRIEGEEGVDRETARAWFGEMLVFLDLCARSDEVLSPPKDVDKAWHAFLLHSRDYEVYCRERFGKLIHHQPTGEPDPEAYRRAYGRRSELSQAGPADTALWTVPVSLTAGGKDAKKGRDAGGGSAGTAACGGASAYGDGSDRGGGFFGGGDSGGGTGGGDSGGGDSGGGSSCGGGGCGGGGS
ncbi:MAG: hypothetical protein H0U32_00135 [Thermoleophilaceae bacterium]|nr:hypothetical protein [Thermoleophilaceae bacterium]